MDNNSVVILDTAGRLHIDEAMMQEVATIKQREPSQCCWWSTR